MTTRSLPQPVHPPVRQVVNIVALGTVLTINALANLLPLGGVPTGEVSDAFPSLVTPAGYVFSIWGVIYALLIGFAVYQALPAQRDDRRLERLGYFFALSCLFNVTWLFAWHYQVFWLTQLLMLGLLVTLILCYERLGIGRETFRGAERFLVALPFSIYLGWITVATVANTSIVLLDLGATGGDLSQPWLLLPAQAWAIIAILAATAIGLTVLARRGDWAYAAVLVWAFVGIAVQQWGAAPSVVFTALAAAAVLAVAAAWRGLRRNAA